MQSIAKTKGFWNQVSSQREFFDKLATKYNVKKPEDWGQVTFKAITKEGGRSLLDRHSSSLFLALKSVYQGLMIKFTFQ